MTRADVQDRRFDAMQASEDDDRARAGLRTDYRRRAVPGDRSQYRTVWGARAAKSLRRTTRGSDARALAVVATATAVYAARHVENPRLVLATPAWDARESGPAVPLALDLRGDVTFRVAVARHEEMVRTAVRTGARASSARDGSGDGVLRDAASDILVALAGVGAEPSPQAFDLVIRFDLRRNRPRVETDYDATLFRPATIELLHDALERIVCEGLEAPSPRVRDVGGLTSAQRTLIEDVNATAQPFPSDRTVIQWIDEVAGDARDRIALICSTGELFSWGALDDVSRRIAGELGQQGVRRGDVVGLMTRRSVAAVAGILGILRSGAGYLPLDRTWPRARLRYVLENAGVAVVVTDQTDAPGVGRSVVFDRVLHRRPPAASGTVSSPLDVAYLIYTSGSTGKPKGVVLDQLGRINNFADFNRRFSIGPEDGVLAVSSLTFDMSAYDVLGTLMAGSRVVMVQDEWVGRPESWISLLRRHRVSVWHSVPTLLGMLLDSLDRLSSRADVPQDLRLFLLGGDWIPVELIGRVRKFWPTAKVVSLGGATELSMDSLIYEVAHADSSWRSVPYGRPMANQNAFVLDERGDLVPLGIAGQLFLGGCGVAFGYAGQPALTAARFVPDRYSGRSGARSYATGDRARLMPDGDLELLGRMDFQVKIRGLRIELGEIEATMREHPAVRDVVVMVTATPNGTKQLRSWLVLDGEPAAALKDLRRMLAARLPAYMLPHVFVPLDTLPTLPNGKIDRRRLQDASSTERSSKT